MKDTRRKVLYFRTKDCKACNGLFDDLNEICKGVDGVELVEKYADDGHDGSRLATALRVQGVPMVMLIEEIHGRRSMEKFERKIRAFSEV